MDGGGKYEERGYSILALTVLLQKETIYRLAREETD
jgi:hypothetical protein